MKVSPSYQRLRNIVASKEQAEHTQMIEEFDNAVEEMSRIRKCLRR